jgi:CheY-like chemotaxis protein
MHHLVDELLHLKKKELHNLPVNIERRLTNIIPIVQTIVANNSIHAGRKNISLQMMIGAENALQITYSTWLRENAFPLICNIDPLKIEQMLNNLITNAIKFSFPNTVVQVTVGTKESQIYISVQDHGQGIPDDEIPKLFEPFSKISVKPTQGETSTGLGLSIVKSIANSHGGSIDVKSKLGVGTAFTVSLPASTTPRAIEEKNAQIPTIMFVDDSTVLQKLVPYMLKKKEYNVIVCSDGLEAFQEWERNGNINLIIMDEEMPRQTGSDTIELIRKREVELGLTRTPVISCTGVQEKDQNILLRKGADKVCTKPFVSEHLLQMVTELLK